MNVKNINKEHIVYALILNEIPVYIGCTMNFLKRREQHRKIKEFDYMLVLKRYDSRQEALIAENAIIRFMSLFNNKIFLNAKISDIVYDKELMDCGYPSKLRKEESNG